jgi:hypothetical protein
MPNEPRARRQICLTIDSEIATKAKEFGINISRAAEEGILQALHIDKPAPVKIDPVQAMKEKLKPLMLQKMKRDIGNFEKTGEIKHIERWVRIVKTMCGVKVKPEDLRAVTIDVMLEAPVLKPRFCRICNSETEHEIKPWRVGDKIRGTRVICQKCLCMVDIPINS